MSFTIWIEGRCGLDGFLIPIRSPPSSVVAAYWRRAPIELDTVDTNLTGRYLDQKMKVSVAQTRCEKIELTSAGIHVSFSHS